MVRKIQCLNQNFYPSTFLLASLCQGLTLIGLDPDQHNFTYLRQYHSPTEEYTLCRASSVTFLQTVMLSLCDVVRATLSFLICFMIFNVIIFIYEITCVSSICGLILELMIWFLNSDFFLQNQKMECPKHTRTQGAQIRWKAIFIIFKNYE